jgi:hypothetical protein
MAWRARRWKGIMEAARKEGKNLHFWLPEMLPTTTATNQSISPPAISAAVTTTAAMATSLSVRLSLARWMT